MKIWAVVGMLAVLGSTPAKAEGLGLGVGAKAGTLGYGVELTKSFTDRINGRLGLNSYSASDSTTESGIDYDIDLNLKTTTAMLDFHPFKGSFRLSLGYVANSNSFDMLAQPVSGSYDINGTTYTEAQVGNLLGDVTFGSGMYAGIGWGNAGDGKGLGFSVDLGVFQQGSPDLSMSATGPIAADPTFAANLQSEIDAAEKDLEDFQQYPVIAVGLTYSF